MKKSKSEIDEKLSAGSALDNSGSESYGGALSERESKGTPNRRIECDRV